MKKKWLAVIAFSLLSAGCSDDNIGNFPSAAGAENPAGIDETPISTGIENPGIKKMAYA